jgi:hypothetical protein
MFGRTASNLRPACGVEVIVIRNAQKMKTKFLHLTAVIAGWHERDHTQPPTVVASWPSMKYFVEKPRQL